MAVFNELEFIPGGHQSRGERSVTNGRVAEVSKRLSQASAVNSSLLQHNNTSHKPNFETIKN